MSLPKSIFLTALQTIILEIFTFVWRFFRVNRVDCLALIGYAAEKNFLSGDYFLINYVCSMNLFFIPHGII